MKTNKVRIAEVAAVIVCIIIVLVLTVVLQLFTSRTLRRMQMDINKAVDCFPDSEVCRIAIDDIADQYKKHKDILLIVYNHADVSDLEFAIECALVIQNTAPHDEARFLIELKRVRSCISTLIEKEQVSIEHLL